MNIDFHYYATYLAARIAGYSHCDSMTLCYSDQFTDVLSMTMLSKLKAPKSAATTQQPMELANARTDTYGLQDITRIWASFHFLPRDLYADPGFKCTKRYKNKFRLICGANGELLKDTVELAKGESLEAAGIAMHVLADTWAHSNFAGTPSLVINNTNYHFYETVDGSDRKVSFRHNPGKPDDYENGLYTNSLYQSSESSIMNLGHGRAGHIPDYSFMRYRYLPAWGNYDEILKDNPSDYFCAFTQMIYALKYLRGDIEVFERDKYDTEAVKTIEDEVRSIMERRQLDSCADWKALAERIFGDEIEDFDAEKYHDEYMTSADKDDTFIGRFIKGALAQKSMVTNRIYKSGNLLAGFSVDYREKGLRGIKDYWSLITGRMEDKR